MLCCQRRVSRVYIYLKVEGGLLDHHGEIIWIDLHINDSLLCHFLNVFSWSRSSSHLPLVGPIMDVMGVTYQQRKVPVLVHDEYRSYIEGSQTTVIMLA